jgi:hypothetical protein
VFVCVQILNLLITKVAEEEAEIEQKIVKRLKLKGILPEEYEMTFSTSDEEEDY